MNDALEVLSTDIDSPAARSIVSALRKKKSVPPKLVACIRRMLHESTSGANRLAAAKTLYAIEGVRCAADIGRALMDDDSDVINFVLKAIRTWRAKAAPAVPHLIKALKGGAHRSYAALALSDIGRPGKAALPLLQKYMKTDHSTLLILTAIVAIDPDGCAPYVMMALMRGDIENVADVLRDLPEAAAARVAPELASRLPDLPLDVRKSVSYALSHVSTPECVPALCRALDDESGDVVQGVLLALCELGKSAGVRGAQAVEKLVMGRRQPGCDGLAINTLWTMGEAARTALTRLSMSGPTQQVRQEAGSSLGHLP